MPADKETIETDWGSRQLELYACELQALYWSERQKRAELAEERLVLQFKLHELETLNKLFQTSLEEMGNVREAYHDLREKLAGLLSGNGDVREGLKNLLSGTETKP